MPIVYVLQHEHVLPGGSDTKLIGVYSTHANAEAAIRRIKLQPGFKDRAHSFTIDRYELDRDNWAEGFITMVGTQPLSPPRRK